MTTKKLIYYYQTFSSLKPLIKAKFENTYVYVAALHFGYDKNNNPYIHLNDSPPDDQPEVWNDIKNAYMNNIKILVLLGGAGGAYGALFKNYDVFYKMLKDFLNKYNYISGIDLNVEEEVTMLNIQKLINNIRTDFGEKFIITMAPIAEAMVTDNKGLGGFSYKKLYNSNVGKYIDWFNVQSYGCYDYSTYSQIIFNGYPEEQIVFGMLGNNFDSSSFNKALSQIKRIVQNYEDMGGCILWEYGDTNIDPIIWGKKINSVFLNKGFCLCKKIN